MGISCMESSFLGRDGSLTEALRKTCVGFLLLLGGLERLVLGGFQWFSMVFNRLFICFSMV